VGIVIQRRSDMDGYLTWLDETPLDQIPPGEDVSDLGALGETRFTAFSREEIIRRIAFARGRGRSWHDIAAYLGLTEEAALCLYEGQGQQDSPAVTMRAAATVISDQVKVIFRALRDATIRAVRELASEMHRERTRL
jgi:hypothetical protein